MYLHEIALLLELCAINSTSVGEQLNVNFFVDSEKEDEYSNSIGLLGRRFFNKRERRLVVIKLKLFFSVS
jgi:hypothetical protein